MIPSNCGAVAAVHLPDFRLDASVEARILGKLVHMKSNEIAPSMKAREGARKRERTGNANALRLFLSLLLTAERHSNELDRLIAIPWRASS